MFWDILVVFLGVFGDILGHIGMFWDVLGCFGMFLDVLGRFVTFCDVLGRFGTFLCGFPKETVLLPTNSSVLNAVLYLRFIFNQRIQSNQYALCGCTLVQYS